MKTTLLFIAFCTSLLTVSASEFFIKVNLSGSYYATVGGQTHYNTTNVFRFFDLQHGAVSVQIFDKNNNAMVFSNPINLGQNQRMIAEVNSNGSMKILETVTISSYNWYTTNTGSTVTSPSPFNGNATTNDGFSQFIIMLEKESFDSNKLEKAKKYCDKTFLTAAQVTEISKKFSFDSNRLDWAKYAYPKCSDKANYFLLEPTFSFTTNYRELETYMETH